MQNTKTITAVQCTSVTNAKQLEQFNVATNKLFQSIGYEDIKPSIDNLLLGWITHDFIGMSESSERSNIFIFFKNLCTHLEAAEISNKKLEDELIPINCYDLFFEFNKKQINEFLDTTLKHFLCTELANDISIRSDVYYLYLDIKEYVNKVLRAKNKPKKELLQL